ncbi:MAG: oxidoreductase, partial [Euryarchaeota archaeon]|nr:oxidoreductase [Euryarchaeota archaeon]
MGPMLEISHRTKDGGKAYSVQIPQFGLGVFLAPADGTCKNACLWAIKAGYRHIDTAAVYRNEEEVGQAIAESGLNRSELFITTKLRRVDALGYQETLDRCEESLHKLGLDFVDLYLVHAPPEDRSCRKEVWRAMEEILETGKARAIGVSHYCKRHLQDILDIPNTVPIAVNQVQYHLGMGPSGPNANDNMKFVQDQGITYQSFSPL